MRPGRRLWTEDVRKAVDRGQALSHYWELYQEDLPSGDPRMAVPTISFWREYKRRYPNRSIEFHQIHPKGSCCEVDYKGSRPGLGYTDPVRGNFVVCELFGAVLGFSQYLAVDVTLTQQKPDFMTSMDRAYRTFGGVPKITVTDYVEFHIIGHKGLGASAKGAEGVFEEGDQALGGLVPDGLAVTLPGMREDHPQNVDLSAVSKGNVKFPPLGGLAWIK